MKKISKYFSAIFLLGFGLLTLFLSASVIFDLFGIREKEGNYVLFVVWANFISSILYLIAASGFLISKPWTAKVLLTSTIFLIVVFVGLLIHVNNGGIHETKTIGAMVFRSSITLVFTIIAYFTISKNSNNSITHS
jgi:hypothetical protein